MRRFFLAFVLLQLCSLARAAQPVQEARLYAIDCGAFDVKDMSFFSDTGEYDGKSGIVADGCFLIRHPKGNLLWDTGMGDNLSNEKKAAIAKMGVTLHGNTSLLEQLKTLDLKPEDITYLAFSHFHSDHTGNANAFTASTWLLNKAELDWASVPGNGFTDPSTFNAYKTTKTEWIMGDRDVFGDGTVRILRTPGHTPGHQSLMIKLKNAGTVILSGDLYHTRDNRKFKRVPAFNVSRADTLASMDRIETIAKNTHARFIIQHSLEDFQSLPKFPSYLD